MNLRSPSHTMPASFHHSFKKASISIDKNTEGGVMKILRNPGINCQHQVILTKKFREMICFLIKYDKKYACKIFMKFLKNPDITQMQNNTLFLQKQFIKGRVSCPFIELTSGETIHSS